MTNAPVVFLPGMESLLLDSSPPPEQDRQTLATLRQIGFPVQWVGCIEGGASLRRLHEVRDDRDSIVQPSDLDTRPTLPGFPAYTPTGDVSPVRLPAI